MVKNFLFFTSLFICLNLSSKEENPNSFQLITLSSSVATLSPFYSTTGLYRRLFEINQKEFLQENLDKIKTEASQGEGRYLSTYFYLNGCYSFNKKKYFQEIKKDYKKIFISDDNNKIHDILKKYTRECSKKYK